MHPTAEVIASWPAPNYVNPVTRGWALTVVNILFIILVFLVAGARFYTRLRITRSWGLDDWMIAISLIPTLGLTIVVLIADNNYGWDKHSWDLHPEGGPPGYKLCISAQVLFFWAAGLNKVSLLCFYRRLSGPHTPSWYTWAIRGGILFHVLMTLVYFTVVLLACRPLKAFWEPLATYEHHCINSDVLMMTFSVITIFLDFILLFLPVPIVWSLQLPRKQRLAVIGIFGAGIIVCIAGVVHAYFVDQALVKSYDETWTGWPLWICSAVEVDLGIICVSAPATRPLLAMYFPRFLESSRPPRRQIKEITDSSELSDQSSKTTKVGSTSSKSTKTGTTSQSSEHLHKSSLSSQKDVEKGMGPDDHGRDGDAMGFTDFSKYAS